MLIPTRGCLIRKGRSYQETASAVLFTVSGEASAMDSARELRIIDGVVSPTGFPKEGTDLFNFPIEAHALLA